MVRGGEWYDSKDAADDELSLVGEHDYAVGLGQRRVQGVAGHDQLRLRKNVRQCLVSENATRRGRLCGVGRALTTYELRSSLQNAVLGGSGAPARHSTPGSSRQHRPSAELHRLVPEG